MDPKKRPNTKQLLSIGHVKSKLKQFRLNKIESQNELNFDRNYDGKRANIIKSFQGVLKSKKDARAKKMKKKLFYKLKRNKSKKYRATM